MKDIADAHDFTFERVDAIDARAKNFEEKCATLHRDGVTGLMSDNTLACTLSHFKAWETFLADTTAGDHAVVFEDDVILAARSLSVINDLEKNGLWGYQLVKLEQGGAMGKGAFVGRRLHQRDGYAVREAHQVLTDAAAYVISREGAAKLVEYRNSICAPVDHFLFYPFKRSGFWGGPFGLVEPAVAIQDRTLDSNIRSQPYLDSRERRDRLRLLYEGRQAGRIIAGIITRRTEFASIKFKP